MTRFSRLRRALVVGLAATAATLSMTQVASAEPAGPTLPPLTADITVPAGNKVFLVGHGKGDQIYTCDGTVWSAAVPKADLTGDNGKVVATHFVGPTWKARDGSTVKATPEVKAFPLDPKAPASIPWLRLKMTSTAPGSDGNQMGTTTYIQRVLTTGGLQPPAADCNAGTKDKVVPVGYTADYFFWKKTGA